MKYVINTRGGAKKVEDSSLTSLLSSGYIQITQKQFEERQYYPEYDRGDMHPVSAATPAQVPAPADQAQVSRTSFKTRVV